ncbi:MAG: hypothetical protein VW270_30640, partial [Candidatus Poseidoniales archaeon]
TMTEQFNGDIATGSYVDYYSSGNEAYNAAIQHASGAADGYWKGPSKWMLASGGAYRWLMFPTFSIYDYPTFSMIKMDTGSNTFSYGGFTNCYLEDNAGL